MVGKSFGIPTILFYLASDANKNKRVGDLNMIFPTYDMVADVQTFFKRALCQVNNFSIAINVSELFSTNGAITHFYAACPINELSRGFVLGYRILKNN